jgi:hypothetical protein
MVWLLDGSLMIAGLPFNYLKIKERSRFVKFFKIWFDF